MDHRLGIRRSFITQVRLARHGGPTASARLLNVSLSGAYVETSRSIALFTRVNFVCGRMLYERIGAFRIAAFVTRATAGGVAVEWLEFAAPVIRRLVELAAPHDRGSRRQSP